MRYGGSQAGQIIFLTCDRNNTCPLSNSSKIKKAVQSTIKAKALLLSEGCDITMSINKVLSNF